MTYFNFHTSRSNKKDRSPHMNPNAPHLPMNGVAMHGSTSQHFSSLELRCKGLTCGLYKNGCQENRSTPELTRALELIRTAVNNGDVNGTVPVIVLDATRCEQHNAATSGAVNDSQHEKGTAADIKVTGFTGAELEAIARRHTDIIRGIGRNDKRNWIHIDTRVSNTLALWCYDEHGKWCDYFEPPAAGIINA